MLDAATRTPPDPAPGLQRSQGRGSVSFSLKDGVSRLAGLHQSGSAKVMLPRSHGAAPEVVFLNTSGGLTGGDHLRYDLTAGPGTRLTATTQTAERAYASLGDPGRMDVTLSVGNGAVVHWLPQETILFNRSHLVRRTTVDLTGDAEFLMAETLVLGRTAMGETLEDLELADWREIRRDGRPVFVDPLRLTTALLRRRTGSALLGEALALSTVVLLAPDARAHLAALRRLLDQTDSTVEAAVSVWDGKLVLRALASDAYMLRRLMVACLHQLTAGALPRVWQN